MKSQKGNNSERSAIVTLKHVAEHAGVTTSTVSAVLNNSPASRSFPESTKERILNAARELNYRPNFFARSLRVKRSYTIGVITEEIGDPYGGMIVSGIEKYLRQRGFFFLTVAHRHDQKLLREYAHLLSERGVEGFIMIDTSVNESPALPTVAVAGHHEVANVTNLILDHRSAAQVVLQHLTGLGHGEIAFMKGPATSSDSEDRWRGILEVGREMGLEINPKLLIRLRGDEATTDLGYTFMKKFLSRNREAFTALFTYNDRTAIGAIRAIQEVGLRVPEDISVVGFDDIESAAYHNPAITTVRQPLQQMGELAARTLLNRIENNEPYVPEIAIEPELVVRHSTGRGRAQAKSKRLKLA